MTQHTVGIFVFDEVEVLDFAGPYEVFTTAARMYRRDHAEESARFRVFTVGAIREPRRARAGLLVHPDFAFADHPPIDVLIIPGGVVTAELARPEVIEWIAQRAHQSTITAAVCTGAFLLARAGLLANRSATTHWEDITDLRTMFPNLRVIENQRWVDEGAVVTSGGISAGIDMSLHLVERLAGRALAERTARQMEFDWSENR